MFDCYGGTGSWNSGGTTSRNQTSWANCGARTEIGYAISSSLLPSDMIAVLKPVIKTYYDPVTSTFKTCEDTLFLPSASELGCSSINPEEGECYAFFSDGKSINTAYDELIMNSKIAGKAVNYWTRTKTSGDGKVYAVSDTGVVRSDSQSSSSSHRRNAYVCI